MNRSKALMLKLLIITFGGVVVFQNCSYSEQVSFQKENGLNLEKSIQSVVSPEERIVLMWQVHPNTGNEDLQFLSENGITHIQSFRVYLYNSLEIERYLNKAEEMGLGVIAYVGNHVGTGLDCTYNKKSLDFVYRYKAHKSIVAWHILDEPANKKIGKDCQRSLYRLIKSIDPNKPAMISANNNSEIKYDKWFTEDAFDILELHYYVNPKPGRGQKNLVDFFLKNRKKSYQVIISFRAFNSPNKTGRVKMVPGSFNQQYSFFIENSGITSSFGFYGWDLNPNLGIKVIPSLLEEFKKLMQIKGFKIKILKNTPSHCC